MGRPPKRNLNYSTWDVDVLENDTSIDNLIDAQGPAGFYVYFALCQKRLRCETCLYWEDFNGVCFCGASPYCADFTDGNDGCCYWQQKEPVTQSPADTEGTE